MAGGKETPRQKLIGMMYLVLLALLALQMGQEILMKFQQLDQSLSLFVTESTDKNTGIVAGIKSTVEKAGNKDKFVVDLANELRAAAAKTITHIDGVKAELVTVTGGINPESGIPEGMKDKDKTSAFLVGEAGNKAGAAYGVKTELDAFIVIANKVEAKLAEKLSDGKTKVKAVEHGSLAYDGKDDPMFKTMKEKHVLDFATLNFDHTEMIASMAFLTERQSRVAALETELLNRIGVLVGATDFKFDKIYGMYRAKSETVAAGTFYEAEMFVSASSSAIKPQMSCSKGLTMKGNMGLIKFKAGASTYDANGISEQSWNGSIKINRAVGGDTTLAVVAKYKVAKPVIQVQAGAVSALYRNCANPLQINVPALGAEYNPSFSVSGGDMTKGSKIGSIVVYPSPSGKSVQISVSNAGTPLGVETFATKAIPKPEIAVLTDGKPMNEKLGQDAPGPRNLTVKVTADPTFASALPTESKYAATQWSATLVRGRKPAMPTANFSSGSGDIGNMRSSAKPGDRIVIEITGVARKTSRGGSEKVEVGSVVKNLQLN
jgi:gliding motility-associated protein GldM